MYILPAMMSGFACMTSGLANFWCQTISFSPIEANTGLPDLHFGPWYVSKTQVDEFNGNLFVRQVCVGYPDGSEIDSKWKTVRAFSVMAPLLGGFLSVALILLRATLDFIVVLDGRCWLVCQPRSCHSFKD